MSDIQEPAKAAEHGFVAPRITGRSLALGIVLAAFFTWFAVGHPKNLANTQVPVIP